MDTPTVATVKSQQRVAVSARNLSSLGPTIHLGQVLLALVLIGLGILGLVSGDFASVWQRIPIENLPGRQFFAYACAVIELATGIGLLVRRTTAVAARVLTVFVLLWVVLLKMPAVLAVPEMEATWLGAGEITVILAGAWVLYAWHGSAWERDHLKFLVGARGVQGARVLFALSLPTIGLAHFAYSSETLALVPKWMPYPIGWVYLTGAGSILAAIAILTTVLARLAAKLEAFMLVAITLLVWGPGVAFASADTVQFQLTGFLMSSAIACGAWVIADSYREISYPPN